MSRPLPKVTLGRDKLIAAILKFLASQDERTLEGIDDLLAHEFDRAGPEAIVRLRGRLAAPCDEWSYYSNDPLARRIHHVLADRILKPGSALMAGERIDEAGGMPVVIVANHLSYSDANVLEVLLHRAGISKLADKLTVMAGPKVYSSLRRRFSSLCFGTIRTPQTSSLSSEDAVMNSREVGRAARQSIDTAYERLRQGDALLVFAEGIRSRSRSMLRMLTGAARYLEGPESWVLPVGIVGSEAMYPIGDDALHPVRIVAPVGWPIKSTVLLERANGDRRLLMDAIGLAVSDLLPPAYRGVYGDDAGELAEARRMLTDVGQSAHGR